MNKQKKEVVADFSFTYVNEWSEYQFDSSYSLFTPIIDLDGFGSELQRFVEDYLEDQEGFISLWVENITKSNSK